MVAIVDYGVGNLFSLRSSLAAIGEEALVTGDAARLRAADRLILPGVGAFGDAAVRLRQSGLDQALLEEARSGKPLLGICLGMQLLLQRSFEYGAHQGLGLIAGSVIPIAPAIPPNYKVPHIGWNALNFPSRRSLHPLFRGLRPGGCVYFVHSYYAAGCESDTIATTEYGADLTAAIALENVCGVQFHPEKSGGLGLTILKNFCKL